MNVGIPGVGLGGLFFIISALLMPLFELARTLRGGSSVARWRFVARQFCIAAGIIVVTAVALWTLALIVRVILPLATGAPGAGGALGGGTSSLAVATSLLPVAPIVATSATLVLVLCGAEGLRWAFRPRPKNIELPENAPEPSRVLLP